MNENENWPKWATLRAEEVSKLPPEEQGQWRNGRPCQVRRGGKHPTEKPYFFYCNTHIREIRAMNALVKPWPARDRGLCISCGNPAERIPLDQNYKLACMEAERTSNTVARMYTKRYCSQCSVKNGQRCRGQECRASGESNTVQAAGCCPITRTGSKRHCAKCCTAARKRQLERENRTLESKAGTNSGKARRKKRSERRRKVAELRRSGLSNEQIAEQISVPEKTVANDIAALDAMTWAARETRKLKHERQKSTMAALKDGGMTIPEIAGRMNLTDRTVRETLQKTGR